MDQKKTIYLNSFMKIFKKVIVTQKSFKKLIEKKGGKYFKIIKENKKKFYEEQNLSFTEDDLKISQNEILEYIRKNPEDLENINNLVGSEDENENENEIENPDDNIEFLVETTFSKLFRSILAEKCRWEFDQAVSFISSNSKENSSNLSSGSSPSPVYRASASLTSPSPSNEDEEIRLIKFKQTAAFIGELLELEVLKIGAGFYFILFC
jgi:hypothetical protein